MGLLSVKRLRATLEEDCMEQGRPCDAHQNNVATRPKPCAGAVIRLDGEKRAIARLFDVDSHFACKPTHVSVLLTRKVTPILLRSKPLIALINHLENALSRTPSCFPTSQKRDMGHPCLCGLMRCMRFPPAPTGRGFCGGRSQGFTLGYFHVLLTGETVARGLSALCFEGQFLPGLKAAIVPAVFRGLKAPAPSGERRRVGFVLFPDHLRHKYVAVDMRNPCSCGVMRCELQKQILRPAFPMNDLRRSRGPKRAGSQDDRAVRGSIFGGAGEVPIWVRAFPRLRSETWGTHVRAD